MKRPDRNRSRYTPFGVDIDPDNELREVNTPDGDIKAFYKGKQVDYDKDFIEILEERTDRA